LERSLEYPECLQYFLSVCRGEVLLGYLSDPVLSLALLRRLHRLSFLEYRNTLSHPDTFVYKLLELIASPETEVFQLVRNILLSATGSYPEIFMRENTQRMIRNGLESRDSILALRYMDITLASANIRQDVFDLLDSNGVIDKAISLYFTDDLLAKLAAVETIGYLGESAHAAQKLLEPRTFDMLNQELSNDNSISYIRNKLVVLFAKLFSYTARHELIAGTYWQLLHSMLTEHEVSANNDAVTALCFLFKKPEGAASFASRESLVHSWFSLQTSPQIDKKTGFYISLATLFRHSPANLAEMILSKNKKWSDNLIKELVVPFPDILENVVSAIEAASYYDWAVRILYGDPRFAEFMLKRSASHSAELAHNKFKSNRNATSYLQDELLLERLRNFVRQGPFAPSEAYIEEAMSRSN
jgi:hypothetical protein